MPFIGVGRFVFNQLYVKEFLMPEKMISLRIDQDLERKVRVEAAKNDLGRSAFIRKTLVEKLVETRTQSKEEPGDDE